MLSKSQILQPPQCHGKALDINMQMPFIRRPTHTYYLSFLQHQGLTSNFIAMGSTVARSLVYLECPRLGMRYGGMKLSIILGSVR